MKKRGINLAKASIITSRNFTMKKGMIRLKNFLEELDRKHETKGNRLYYLSTQPSYFTLICDQLQRHQLIYREDDDLGRWSRVIIEKPFGHNYLSSLELHTQLCKSLNENQIYRIDHWLGKETVQNLMVLRFSNAIFESVWNQQHIDHIQITVAEDIGIGSRGNLFEESGMLRDVVQNHMMQLLSLVAMEPPGALTPDSIRDEKVKVLQCLRPFTQKTLTTDVVRGQYKSGWIHEQEAAGYREEGNVSPDSKVETYCAFKCFIDNWRWSGVPFYLRAGKRLPKKVTEIAITFKAAPTFLFKKQTESNVLVIRIQPDEGISLKMNCKLPGFTAPIHPVLMDFRYNQQFNATPPEAYELLILNAMSGDNTLFARIDEVLYSWKFFNLILDFWASQTEPPLMYPAGSWGPAEADKIISQDNRSWRLL